MRKETGKRNKLPFCRECIPCLVPKRKEKKGKITFLQGKYYPPCFGKKREKSHSS
jgi:hypothetical protein